jgi:hypothetical protein
MRHFEENRDSRTLDLLQLMPVGIVRDLPYDVIMVVEELALLLLGGGLCRGAGRTPVKAGKRSFVSDLALNGNDRSELPQPPGFEAAVVRANTGRPLLRPLNPPRLSLPGKICGNQGGGDSSATKLPPGGVRASAPPREPAAADRRSLARRGPGGLRRGPRRRQPRGG